jgi:hypothetical protein
MNYDPALTSERIDALNAVDLRLVGVTHGATRGVGGIPHVEGGDARDFDRLAIAANELNPEHGDAFAVEPTGFASPLAEEMTLRNILPIDIPNIPADDMPQDLREGIAEFLEEGRHGLHLNNLAYTAAHALLRGVPVHRAEVSDTDWEMLGKLLPELGPAEVQSEIRLFYRNTKMLAKLGDIAMDMKTDNSKPILLFASGGAHTPRLGKRLSASGVAFTANI